MPFISACMIVRDEAENLPACLSSLQNQVDEIVIVDTGSSDATVEIARDHGARVTVMEWLGDFSAARNRSLTLARGSHLLVIDADETAPTDLREQICTFIEIHPRAFGRVRIRSAYRTAAAQPLHSIAWVSRLLPRTTDVEFVGIVHEQLHCKKAELPRMNTGITLEHSGYARTAEQATFKSSRNKSLLEMALLDNPDDAYLWFQLGKTHEASDDWAQAENAYARSWQLVGPDRARDVNFTPDLLLGYLHALKHQRRPDPFFTLMDIAQNLYPDLPDLPFLLAGGLMGFGIPDFGLIRRCYERCLELGEQGGHYDRVEGTGSYLAWYNLGAFHEALGNTAAAADAYAKSAELNYAAAAPAARRLGIRLP